MPFYEEVQVTTATWTNTTAKSTAPGLSGVGARFTGTNGQGNYVTFRPNVPTAGLYDVHFTYPAGANFNSPGAQFLIRGNSTDIEGAIDVAGSSNKVNSWIPLATGVSFAAGNSGFIKVTNTHVQSNDTGGRFPADAIRLTPSYPSGRNEAIQKWRVQADNSGYTFFRTMDIAGVSVRGMDVNRVNGGSVLVAGNAVGNHVYRLDKDTGTLRTPATLPGMYQDTSVALTLNKVGATVDGVIYACTLSVPGRRFDIFRHQDEMSTHTVAYSETSVSETMGSDLAVTGAGPGTKILVAGSSGKIYLFTTQDGGLTFTKTPITPTAPAVSGTLAVAWDPNGEDYWIRSLTGSAQKYSGQTNLGLGAPFSGDVPGNGYGPIGIVNFGSTTTLGIGIGNTVAGTVNKPVTFYDLTNPSMPDFTARGTEFIAGAKPNAAGQGDIAFDPVTERAFILYSNNTISAFDLHAYPLTRMQITKTSSHGSVVVGDPFMYTIKVRNNGETTKPESLIIDPLPANISLVSASADCNCTSNTVTCTVPALGPGEEKSVSISVNSTAAAPTVNTASTSHPLQRLPGASSSVATTIRSYSPIIVKTANVGSVTVGDLITYTITVQNSSATTKSDMLITDPIPEHVSFVSASPGCSYSSGTVTCNLQPLRAGGTTSVSVVVKPLLALPAKNTAFTSHPLQSGLGLGSFVVTQVEPKSYKTPLQRLGLGQLNGAVTSPDGKRALTFGTGLYLWDIATQTVIRSYPGNKGLIYRASFSPDGKFIIADGDPGQIYDVETGTIAFPQLEAFRSAAFSHDSSRVTFLTQNNEIVVVNAANGNLSQRFAGGHQGEISYSNDDTKIFVSDQGVSNIGGNPPKRATLFNAVTGSLISSITRDTLSFQASLSSDGQYVITATAEGLFVWNASSGELIRSLPIGSLPIFSPGGQHFVTSSGSECRIYDLQTGELRHSLPGARLAAYSPNGSLIVTRYDNTTKMWDAGSGGILWSVSHGNTVSRFVSFAPDGQSVICDIRSDEYAEILDPATGNVLHRLNGFLSGIGDAVFARNGAWASTTAGFNGVNRWNARTGANLGGDYIYSNKIAYSADETRYLTCSSTFLRIHDAASGEIRQELNHGSSVTDVAFSPNGEMIASAAEDGTFKLWSAQTGFLTKAVSAHTLGVSSIVFSQDGEQVLTFGSYEKKAKLWDVLSGALTQTFPAFNRMNSADISPDGQLVLTTGDGSIGQEALIWNVQTGQVIRTLQSTGFNNAPGPGTFSPDGRQVAIGESGGAIKLWDVQSATKLADFKGGHIGGANHVSYSSDGRYILSAGGDGVALVWEVAPPRAVIVAGGGNYSGNSIAQQTDDLAAYAYKTLRARGYAADDIQYLSAFPDRDADGDNSGDVDAAATPASLQEALTGEFASSAGRLLVLMVDHGYRTNDFMAFQVNPTQVVTTAQMNEWMNDVQTSSPVDLTLVVDCCYAGAFVDDCSAAPQGRKRVVIASTTSAAESVFLPPPDMSSFMQTFLSSAYMGNSVGEAFRAGQRFFSDFPVANQEPQISDNSAANVNVDEEFFGVSWAYGVQSTQDINRFFPAFESWTSNTTVLPVDPVRITARVLPGQLPLAVTAAIRPPAPLVLSGDPVTILPRVQLTQSPQDASLWEAQVPGNSLFNQTGGYSLCFTATFGSNRVSSPVYGSISVNAGPDPDLTPVRAILAVGDSDAPALATSLAHQSGPAYRSFLDRFQSPDGIKHPEWIAYYPTVSDAQRDGLASAANVLGYIAQLGTDVAGPCRLYIHLVGETDNNAGRIRMADGDYLTASALKSALDSWQSAGAGRVAVVSIDSPGSGAFLPGLANATYQRVIITSGRAEDGSLILPLPSLTSFTQKYLGAATQGNSILGSFNAGQNFFQSFLSNFLNSPIQPQLDDNGDGVFTSSDGQLAAGIYLGRRYAFAGNEAAGLPFLLDVSTTQTAQPGQLVTFEAHPIEGLEPLRVFAQLVSPSAYGSGAQTVLPEVDFVRQAPDSWTWQSVFNAPEEAGTWSVNVYAIYPDGEREALSEPRFSALEVAGSPVPGWSLY